MKITTVLLASIFLLFNAGCSNSDNTPKPLDIEVPEPVAPVERGTATVDVKIAELKKTNRGVAGKLEVIKVTAVGAATSSITTGTSIPFSVRPTQGKLFEMLSNKEVSETFEATLRFDNQQRLQLDGEDQPSGVWKLESVH